MSLQIVLGVTTPWRPSIVLQVHMIVKRGLLSCLARWGMGQETLGGKGAPVAGRIAAVSIVDAVASDLRSRIFAGELGSGDALTESEVASAYDVARPTAKAAPRRTAGATLGGPAAPWGGGRSAPVMPMCESQ